MIFGANPLLLKTKQRDPFFTDVTSLLHFNGTDGSTVFTDELGNTWSVFGNAQIDTAQSKFGGASGLFDGAGDYISTPYSTSSFDWWVGAYTIECWVRAASWAGWSYTASSGTLSVPLVARHGTVNTDENFWSFGPDTSGRLAFYYFSGSTQGVRTTATMATNTWHHIAMTTDGTNIRLFINGVLQTTVAISGTPLSNSARTLHMGAGNNGTTNLFINGWVDDFRITKGTQRYTATFTPPDKQFPDA